MTMNSGLSRRRMLGLTGAGVAGTVLSGLSVPAAEAATTPAIFYAPHADDEALGYGGQIRQHKNAGRPVYLVLVTQGQNDGLLKIMKDQSDPCSWIKQWCSFPDHHHTSDTASWTEGNIVSGRTAEFYKSAHALGVDKIINWSLPELGTNGQTYLSLVSQVKSRVSALNKAYPGASHKFPAGWLDAMDTHKAISDAAYELRDEIPDMRFTYCHVYGAVPDQADRDNLWADYILPIPLADMNYKRNAIMAYNTYDPTANLYTLGYHSYQVGLENAWLDQREWIYLLPSTYQLGPVPSEVTNLGT
jgi:LmbE family N-acetylglucosaminyl deacetylase